MKDKSFLYHFLIIGSGTALNMLIGVITTPVITRMVNPIEYGQYSIFLMYSSIAVMVLCLGMDQALVRYYYEVKSIGYQTSLFLKCITYPILAGIGVSICFIWLVYTGKVNFEFNIPICIALCIYVNISIINRLISMLIRLEYNSKLYSTLNVLNKILYMVIAIVALILFKSKGLECLVFASIITIFICTVVAVISQKQRWIISMNGVKECAVSQKDLLKYALPYVPALGVSTIFQAVDKIALNYYCSYTEVGIYSSTLTLVSIFAIIQTTFNTLWTPMQVKSFQENPDDKTFFQNGNQIITVVMFFFGISLILVKDVFALLLGEQYRAAAYILPFLIFNPIMYTISETTVGGLVFMKKSGMQIVVAIGACTTNIIGNIILVPLLGCRGAAISTGIAYIVFFTLRTMLSNHYYPVDYKLGKFYILTIVSLLYALYNTFVKFNWGSIIGYIVVAIVICGMYKSTVNWCLKYVFDTFKKTCHRDNNRDF